MKTFFRFFAALVLASFAFTQAAQAIPPSTSAQLSPATISANGGALSPQVYNYTPASLPKWRAALANVQAGTGYATISWIGDSITMGAGSGTAGQTNTTGARANAVTAQVKKLFNNIGVPAVDESTWGDNITPTAGLAGITAYDPRVTFSGSPTWQRSNFGLAGNTFFSSGANTDPMTFTPSTAVDTCKVWFARNAGFSNTTNILDASGTLGTINATGTASLANTTVTRTLGSGYVSIAKVNTGSLYIYGIDCWNSAVKSVRIFNWGAYGWPTANFLTATNPWSTLNAFGTVGQNLTIINLGVNDYRTGVSAATYKANMQQIITAAKLSGDVLLLRYQPDNAPVHPELLADYFAAQMQLSNENNIPLIDLTARFVSYSTSSSEYYDTVHLNAGGYADTAMAVWNVIRPQ